MPQDDPLRYHMIAVLQRTLHDEFPLTRHLAVRVVNAQLERVSLAAPLAENRNHKGTAFAGSLNAVATLAGWSWFWLLLDSREEVAQVVVQDSTIHYTRPVRTDFTATCEAPGMGIIAQCLAAYHRSGRGRMRLAVEIADEHGIAATFSGRFVAEHIRGGVVAAPSTSTSKPARHG
jgi:thioesterase domain-containing protein